MIDPYKYNTVSQIGKEAWKLSSNAYTSLITTNYDNVLNSVRDYRREVKEGKKKIVEISNEIFL